jgi:hypothetical protein
MSEIERERPSVAPTKKFDEANLSPAQRQALELARAQGKRPMPLVEAMRLDIDTDELVRFAETLDEQRRESRSHPRKDRLG